MDTNRFSELRSQSTWRLLLLAVITLGVYSAHYIKAQTVKVDSLNSGKEPIGSAFAQLILGLSYISLITLGLYLISPDNLALELVDSLLGLFVAILQIVWGFKVRNRVNAAFALEKGTAYWFHGFWTFLFTPLYFNYKVNTVCESLEQWNKLDSNS